MYSHPFIFFSDKRHAPVTLHMGRAGITQWNNCTALQLCHTGISTIAERFAENEEKVMWEDQHCLCICAKTSI